MGLGRRAQQWLIGVLAAGVVGYAVTQTISFSSRRYQRDPPQRLHGLSDVVKGRELDWVVDVLRHAHPTVRVVRRGPVVGLWSTAREVRSRRSHFTGEEVISVVGTRSSKPALRVQRRASGCRPTPVRHRWGQSLQGKPPFFVGGLTNEGVLQYEGRGRADTLAYLVYLVAGPSYEGPVLVRGFSVDHSGQVRFRQSTARGSDGVAFVGNAHEMHFPAGEGLRMWGATIELSRPGCYALQLNGTRVARVLTFETGRR